MTKELDINNNIDLDITTWRSGDKSGCRILHKPTGCYAECSEFRSQYCNLHGAKKKLETILEKEDIMVDRSHDSNDKFWRVSFTIQLTDEEKNTFHNWLRGVLAEELSEDITDFNIIPVKDPFEIESPDTKIKSPPKNIPEKETNSSSSTGPFGGGFSQAIRTTFGD